MNEFEVIEAFVKRVNARAEANIQKTHKLEGSHYAAMMAELKLLQDREPVKDMPFFDEETCTCGSFRSIASDHNQDCHIFEIWPHIKKYGKKLDNQAPERPPEPKSGGNPSGSGGNFA